MFTRQGNVMESLRAVQDFLDTNADRLGNIGTSGARLRLDETIALLSTHIADQSGEHLTAMGLTRQQFARRKTLLRDHMAPVARIARAELPVTPELAPLRMPRGSPGVQRLDALARGMAQAAEPFADVFIAFGRAPDFVARLNAAAERMLDAGSERRLARASGAGATVGLKQFLTRGRKIVHVLDALVTTQLQGDEPLLAHWNSIKRVKRVAVRGARLQGGAAVVAELPSPFHESTHPTAAQSQGAAAS